jgi:YD repeat-containing protein
LYPFNAQMTTYCYSPNIGMTHSCDADNRITYYFYDGLARLKWIKDQDGNIIKTIKYHFLAH